MVPETKSITQTHLQRLLLLGLCLSAMLLLSALLVAWRAVHPASTVHPVAGFFLDDLCRALP